jgi:hypothetical protein
MPPDGPNNPTKLKTTTRSKYFYFLYPFVRYLSRSSIDRQLEDSQAYAPATCMLLVVNGKLSWDSASDDSEQSRHDETVEVHGCPRAADNHAFSWPSAS